MITGAGGLGYLGRERDGCEDWLGVRSKPGGSRGTEGRKYLVKDGEAGVSQHESKGSGSRRESGGDCELRDGCLIEGVLEVTWGVRGTDH